MLFRLFLLFTLVPLVELYLLIRVGTYLGVLDTIAIVITTAIVGGLLARSQGLAVLNRILTQLNEGRIPAESLFDGVFILVAGFLLITPGTSDGWPGISFSDSLDPASPETLVQAKGRGKGFPGRDPHRRR